MCGPHCKTATCDICESKDCADQMSTEDGLKLCPLCAYRLRDEQAA